MTSVSADLALAVDGLMAAVIQIGIGALVLGVAFIGVYLVVRGSIR